MCNNDVSLTIRRVLSGLFLCLVSCVMWAGGVKAAGGTDGTAASLGKVILRQVAASEKGTVKLSYDPVPEVTHYHIFRSPSEEEDWEEIGVTKKLSYTDSSGKAGKSYRYYVVGTSRGADKTLRQGRKSRVAVVKVRKKPERIAYAGDSVMTGFSIYKVITGGGRRVFAEKGLSTVRFYNGSVIRKMLAYRPDRVYIMLGINSLVGSPGSAYIDRILSFYQKILTSCCKSNPDMEIIAVSVAPVGSTKRIKQSKVNEYNRKLKKLTESFPQVEFCDQTPLLADRYGRLLKKYAAGDGIHWKKLTYPIVLKYWDAFAKVYTTDY